MVLYFSGTGNSRYIATRIADGLGDDLLNMNDRIKDRNTHAVQSDQRIVVVTPTYAWRIPRIVRDWITRTGFQGARQAWFVMNCGSEIGNAAKYNRLLCAEKGFAYMGTAQILMPENYIALFSTPEPERARQIISAAEPAIDSAIRQIASGQPFTAPRNKLCDRIMSGPVNAAFHPLCVKAGPFHAGRECIGCGKCVRLCPLNNIALKDGRPVWGKNCTHCMACISCCPLETVEYGKSSRGKPRYYFEKLQY